MAKSVVKPMSEEEVRALFEEAMLGVKDKQKAVPTDRFYATLEKAATDPEQEALLPMLLSIYNALYVSEVTLSAGTAGGINLDLVDSTVSFTGAAGNKMQVQSHLILPNIQRQKDVILESHLNFI